MYRGTAKRTPGHIHKHQKTRAMIEKIIAFIVRLLPQDKLLHIFAGQLIAALFLGLFFALHLPVWIACVLAFLFAAGAGIGKEFYDKKHRGHSVEWQDAVATAVGGLIAVLYAAYWIWCGGGYLCDKFTYYAVD